MVMDDALKDLFVRDHRDKMVVELNENPKVFERAIKKALSSDEAMAWRAAWLLGKTIINNDDRIKPHITPLINSIPDKKDGHQREILKIVERMELNEDQEGLLFDQCMNIWESVGKSPSVRITSFRIMLKIAEHYPDLGHELEFLTQDQYLETLSPGIRTMFGRDWEKFRKKIQQ